MGYITSVELFMHLKPRIYEVCLGKEINQTYAFLQYTYYVTLFFIKYHHSMFFNAIPKLEKLIKYKFKYFT